VRTVIIAYRSTVGVSISRVSNSSLDSGRSSGAPVVKSSPIEWRRSPMLRDSSFCSNSRIRVLSSSRLATDGTGLR
jgi:hypothetical protein